MRLKFRIDWKPIFGEKVLERNSDRKPAWIAFEMVSEDPEFFKAVCEFYEYSIVIVAYLSYYRGLF